MKVFLFLYPLKTYFEGDCPQRFKEQGHSLKRLDKIINARYRQKNYQIYWAVFSETAKKNRPDLSDLSEYLSIPTSDKIITVGIPSSDLKQGIYPQPSYILEQLPNKESISQLTIGGFHATDCVEKLASLACHQGWPVRVDDDTTELFFPRTLLKGNIPLKPATTLEDIMEKEMVEFCRGLRQTQPWLPQI